MISIGIGIDYLKRSGSSLDPSAQAFITAAGITDLTQINAINTLVVGMKSAGIYSKMKAVYPFVGGTATTCKYNLIDPRDLDAAFRLTFNGGWTFSENGATPNGTNGYADTYLVANTSMNYNSQSYSVYLRTGTAVALASQFGSFGGSPYSGVCLFPYNGYNGMNDNILSPTMTSISTNGFTTFNRNNENIKKLFKNGSLIDSKSTTASNLSNSSIYLGCSRVGGSANYFSNNQISFFNMGDGLTDTEASNFYTLVQSYQSTLNRAV